MTLVGNVPSICYTPRVRSIPGNSYLNRSLTLNSVSMLKSAIQPEDSTIAEMPQTQFSNELWREASSIDASISRHPFLLELQQGTLPLEKFRFYIIQDYIYLGAFGRAAASALAMAPDDVTARKLLLRVSTPVERPLHTDLFEKLSVTPDEINSVSPAPTNLAYMNHIEVSMDLGGLAAGVAALLPCPRIYHEVGKSLQVPPHPIYRAWQSTYAEGILEESVAAWSELVDQLAGRSGPDVRTAMRRAYLTSARYEFMFWSMAYNLEEWPA